MAPILLYILIGWLAAGPEQAGATTLELREKCSIFYTGRPAGCEPPPDSFLEKSVKPFTTASEATNIAILEDVYQALVVLQDQYFDADYGTWPSAIDWTSAVVGTIISGTLRSLTKSHEILQKHNETTRAGLENIISSTYAQVVGSYYGQDIVSLRGQAFDDMLWIVLGWIETINFVKTHSNLHFPSEESSSTSSESALMDAMRNLPWHGNNWVCAFAHRARIFWNLSEQGWETHYCKGGMVWDSKLKPYKNAITNELWISASAAMYQDFPGDNFTAPWLANIAFPSRDPAHLAAAVEGYKWLMSIGMVNDQGLFADGFHVNHRKPGNTNCDLRDEMVYTYNQGVILTGQRRLWAISGSYSYLQDGHDLIQSVIKATGWSLQQRAPVDSLDELEAGRLPCWRGLGRGGVLEESCDASGTCSQDGQTFKGIFFHHLNAFCTPLEPLDIEHGMHIDEASYVRIKSAHSKACQSYLVWVKYNAIAALETRDEAGRFGMWWGASLFGNVNVSRDNDGIDHAAENATDYRNFGTPDDDVWGSGSQRSPALGGEAVENHGGETSSLVDDRSQQRISSDQNIIDSKQSHDRRSKDPNSRGRGRTVETQAGGLALLKAYWDMSQLYE